MPTDSEVIFAEGPTLRVLDAATGQVRAKIRVPAEAAAAGDTDWKWIAQDGDRLWAAWGPPDARVAAHRQRRQMGHWPWDVADRQYKSIVEDFGAARALAAYQYPEMKLLWRQSETEAFDVRALCMESGRIFQLRRSCTWRLGTPRPASCCGARRTRPRQRCSIPSALPSNAKVGAWDGRRTAARASDGIVCLAGPPFKKTIGISLEKGELLWALDMESPHPFFFNVGLYVVPRVAAPQAVCRKVEPLTGKTLDEYSLGVIGSCTRLTVTPNQFYYRPGGGEGRTVYVDIAARKLAPYEGVVRPGCFDGVLPANGRLYWMPLACDCWQVHGTFSMAPRSALKEPEGNAVLLYGWRRARQFPRPQTTGRCIARTWRGRRRSPPSFRRV